MAILQALVILATVSISSCVDQISVICNDMQVHRLTFSPSETVASVTKKVGDCCGIPDGKTILVDYWPYKCQVDSGFNEVYPLDKTMEECEYNDESQGLTFLAAHKKYRQDSTMGEWLTIYFGDGRTLKISIANNPTIKRTKVHLVPFTGVQADCMTLVDWYINPKVEADDGQLLDEKRFSDYNIVPSSKRRMIIILENKECKKLTPGTWIMYGKNIAANIECQDDELVSAFKERAASESGVPIDKMWIFDLLPNPKQDADGGQLKPEREMSYYGGCKGKIFVIGELKEECAKK